MMPTVSNTKIDNYSTFLKEKYRPPSRGGNTKALHAHVVEIGADTYSFLALGSQKWIYKSDTVSFEYEVNGPYNNILKDTIRTYDKNGVEIVRGNRGYKRQLRTADTRMPVSRREMK